MCCVGALWKFLFYSFITVSRPISEQTNRNIKNGWTRVACYWLFFSPLKLYTNLTLQCLYYCCVISTSHASCHCSSFVQQQMSWLFHGWHITQGVSLRVGYSQPYESCYSKYCPAVVLSTCSHTGDTQGCLSYPLVCVIVWGVCVSDNFCF